MSSSGNNSSDNFHIIVITTFYPNKIHPQRAVFTENLVKSISKYCKVTVISPVPFFPGIKRTQQANKIPLIENRNGIEIHHPRFLSIPKLEMLSTITYFLGTLGSLSNLRRKSKDIILHGHRIYPDGTAVALLARFFHLPYVLTAHGSDINRTSKKFGMKKQMAVAMEKANALIAVSDALKNRINELVDTNITKIPCAGFDPEIFNYIDKKQKSSETSIKGKSVIYIGNLLKLKGVGLLVEAWHSLSKNKRLSKDDKLILIGEGNYRKKIEELIDKWDLSKSVILTGSIGQHEIPAYLVNADALCLPSFMEGMPNVIIEALSCGTPVCASNVGGIPEILKNKINGILINQLDSEHIADALLKTLETEWDKNRLQDSVKDHTWDNLAKQNYNCYKKIMLDT